MICPSVCVVYSKMVGDKKLKNHTFFQPDCIFLQIISPTSSLLAWYVPVCVCGL